MKIIKIDKDNSLSLAVRKAAEILTSGGIIVYPTDTCYGIGVNATNDLALKSLYNLKGRSFMKPTHVTVRNWKMIEKLTYPNILSKKLFVKFLPGPLTLILKKRDNVSDILTASLPTLGVRIPDVSFTLSLSNIVDFPYTAPSANRSGEPSPYSLKELKQVLDLEKVNLVVDAGILPKVIPSTIVETTENHLNILRQGPISKSQLESAI